MKTQHTIENVELEKNGHQGDCLTYTADGEDFNITGQFYVDRAGQLHHTHLFPNGDEMEITVPYNE